LGGVVDGTKVRAHLSAVPDPQIPLLFLKNSIVIPLLFHCSQKRLLGRKSLKLLAGRAPAGPDFFKNSLLIPLLPQIQKRFQRDGAEKNGGLKRTRPTLPPHRSAYGFAAICLRA
jgi:hypothetical protein